MWRGIASILLVIATYLAGEYFWNIKVVEWKTQAKATLVAAQAAKTDPTAWASVEQQADKLPSVFPFTHIKNIFPEVHKIFDEVDALRVFEVKVNNNALDINTIWDIFENLKNIQTSIENIYDDIDGIPNFLLNPEQIKQKQKGLQKINLMLTQVEDILKLEKILTHFADRNERILILLQNQNEPRSTGGFTGSIVLIDFEGSKLSWKFSDIYALDRLVPESAQSTAPTFFHGLSKNISLRDANFWPDFPTTAGKYRHFFDSIDEKIPGTIVGINMNTVSEILKITGPIKLEKWGFTLDEHNFDLGLQFLVESKITGRYQVKKPLELFIDQVFQKLNNPTYTIEGLAQFDWKSFVKAKNILVHTQNRSLQKLMEKWKLNGEIRKQREADNFLYFDFISVGANKSDKFVWTKLWHDSTISPDGAVRNFLEIKRTHALQPDEIKNLLGFNTLPENVRDLLNPDLLWKLGAGENRTVMRVYVPKDAKILSSNIPSGKLKNYTDRDTGFQILEFPINILPGEKSATKIEYKTHINRGSHGWRPYFLEVLGTPGRGKTTFLETISTTDNGKFTAETRNLGHPEPLIDNEYRAVVEWATINNE